MIQKKIDIFNNKKIPSIDNNFAINDLVSKYQDYNYVIEKNECLQIFKNLDGYLRRILEMPVFDYDKAYRLLEEIEHKQQSVSGKYYLPG